uniref:disintegrin and metalloproteinase domain-containing protein 12-like isoform X2 n=1 Tax=Myxine glutinosa TaxID=7769 RepID=UPI00358E052D
MVRGSPSSPGPGTHALLLIYSAAFSLLSAESLRGFDSGHHLEQDVTIPVAVPLISKTTGMSLTNPLRIAYQLIIEGKPMVLELEKNEGLLPQGYVEMHYSLNGTLITEKPDYADHCYYHGAVWDYHGSSVALSTCFGLWGYVSLTNRTYFIKPLEGSVNGRHHISLLENVSFYNGTCNHEILRNSSHYPARQRHGYQLGPLNNRAKRDAKKNMKYVELIIVADNHEFVNQKRNLPLTKQRMIEVANYIDKFYKALNIRIALVGVEVWTDRDKVEVGLDASTTLFNFLRWRKKQLLARQKHDNSQLVTGIQFQGTTVGMAPLSSMCSAEQSGGVSMDHSDPAMGLAATMAHELGHNFGMNHDVGERNCYCKSKSDEGGCIMAPATGKPFPRTFSSCSQLDLEKSLEKGGGVCLYNMPDVKTLYGGQRCGNGYVEPGEECDCGDIEECENRCCNANNCTLRHGIECAHGACCEDCQLKPLGTGCRGSTSMCDLPEYCNGVVPVCPPNVYLLDGSPCEENSAYCYNGMCRTHEQQCNSLWGPGAKPAPDICFTRVNSAGDKYGNCGKDSVGRHMKCKPSDVKCGKIQCQGGAKQPIIGSNAVNIDTNILQGDGRTVLCRGTHVYFGEDLADPGLVLTGTKCHHSKICYNRQCVNVSVLGTVNCDAKCNGNGVCNSNHNCHCDEHWAPPHCENPGHGGSIDSGPIRPSRERELTIALLLTFFLVLPSLGLLMYICYRKRLTLWEQCQKRKNRVLQAFRDSAQEKGRVARVDKSDNPGKRPRIATVIHEDIQLMENHEMARPFHQKGPLPHNGQLRKIGRPSATICAPACREVRKGPPRPTRPLASTPMTVRAKQARPARPSLPSSGLSSPEAMHVQPVPKPAVPQKPLPHSPGSNVVASPTSLAGKAISPNLAAIAACFSEPHPARPVPLHRGQPSNPIDPKYLIRK